MKLTDELKTKLMKAQNAEEIAALLKAADEDESLAEQLWKEVSAHREDRQLDPDELEAVSGGTDRDWATDGCCATVGPDSWCYTNDGCMYFSVTYDHLPCSGHKCPKCGTYLYWISVGVTAGRESESIGKYVCKKCGYFEYDY